MTTTYTTYKAKYPSGGYAVVYDRVTGQEPTDLESFKVALAETLERNMKGLTHSLYLEYWEEQNKGIKIIKVTTTEEVIE
jgi:hypothetical protein